MKLTQLLREFPNSYHLYDGDAEVTGVVSDSRQVRPGFLFVAVVGEYSDGHRFIPDAVERGAAAVVGMEPISQIGVPYLLVEDSRVAVAHLAAAFFGYPARKLTVIGVTGTDGKTTTTNMIYRILLAAHLKTGMISTINAVIGDEVLDTGFHVTTPDAPEIQHYMSQMVDAGITHVVLEVTSHGIAQARVEACEFDVAVVTNITHEHLDYHGTYEVYRATKARLIESLKSTRPKMSGNPRTAVLNRDDDSYNHLSNIPVETSLSYGFHPGADIRPTTVKYNADGMSFIVTGKGLKFECVTPLIGDFNISNSLAAVGATTYALGLEPGAAQAGIASLRSVPGRMERIELGQDFTAIVDFAHTPNALKVALHTVRQITQGRVIAVFGAAGLRDRQKRHLMAETSLELADITILTAEDPRTEKLEDILEEMARGAISRGGVEGQNFWRIPDRGEAIRFAIRQARQGDVVIACGKGHEQSMCFGQVEYAWDDRIAMRAALFERLGLAGPKMPSLPTQDQ